MITVYIKSTILKNVLLLFTRSANTLFDLKGQFSWITQKKMYA